MRAWPVDLAPRHKVGLPLRSRVIIAAGISRLGYPTQLPYALDGVGAIITGPWSGLSQHPRYPILIPRPSGVLWVPPRPPSHTSATLRRVAPKWPRSVAIVAALGPGDVSSTRDGARRLAREGRVVGFLVEVGAEEPLPRVLARVDVVREQELPVWVALPLHRVAELVPPVLNVEADALVIGMPPEGLGYHRGRRFHGRLYGPLVFPLMLSALIKAVALARDVPVIAQGGIHSPQDALRCLEVGAAAVALDAAVWVEPDLPAAVHEAIVAWEEAQHPSADTPSEEETL